MDLFDLHCDTAFEMYRTKADIYSNELCVSVDKFGKYDRKAQVFAVWADRNKSDDECFLEFRHIIAETKEKAAQYPDLAVMCGDSETLKNAGNKLCIIPAVEDARMLGGDLSRLEKMYSAGVRILTLGWEGNTCVCGGYDTEDGLTDFGFEVLSECEKLGITVDVSHLSEKGFWDVAGRVTKPFIASHSNSMALCTHRRNLTDTQFRTIVSHGGIVGVSLVGKHLSAALEDNDPEEGQVYEAVCSHIEHYLEMAPKNTCLGMDFDGTGPLRGLENVANAENIAKALSNRGCDEKAIQDVFFNNAYAFFEKALQN